METTPTSGAGSPGSGDPRRSAPLNAAIAVIALLLLIDAAVETFLAGSPVRWWISPPAVVFAAATVWLWRPGAWLASRFGWAGAAAWSLTGLLALIAVSAWLPGGTETGLRLVLQTTPRVLASTLVLAVLLAALVLADAARVLPTRFRLIGWAVVGLIALYGVASLSLAIVERAPFAVLFHGGAAWQRLPRWLQGTPVGAIWLVLLAILVRLVAIAVRLSRKQPVRLLAHQATALVMTFVMALAGIVRAPVGVDAARRVSPELEKSIRQFEQSRLDVLSAMMKGDSTSAAAAAPTVDQLDKLAEAIDHAAEAIPRDTFDLQSVVTQTGGEPANLFQWVRDHTFFVPYQGALRGPTGVLMDRLGNSLDRALLLAALLKAASRSARLAHATLTAEQASALMSRARPVPDRVRQIPERGAATEAAIAEFARTARAAPATLVSTISNAGRGSEAFIKEAADLGRRQSAELMRAIGTHAQVAATDPAPAVADHWWVQLEGDSGWLDLDPGPADAKPGDSIASASDTTSPEDLPSDTWHQVEVRVVIEQASGSQLTERVAFSRTLRPADLFGVPVILTNVPLGLSQQTFFERPGSATGESLVRTFGSHQAWLPVLQVGDDYFQGKAFTTGGDIVEGSDQPGGSGGGMTGGLGDLLGGGDEPSKAPPPSAGRSTAGQLTAEWIEYETKIPGRPATIIRREVFDGAGPAARSSDRQASLPDIQQNERGLALITRTDILVLPCRLSPEFVLWLRASALRENRAGLSQLLRAGRAQPPTDRVELLAKLALLPAKLYQLALARHALGSAGSRVYLSSPNILSLHRGASQPNPGRFAAFQAFDIVANGVDVISGGGVDPFEARVRQGVDDTNAESLVMAGTCCSIGPSGAAPVFAQASASGVPWTVLRQTSDAGSLPWPANARSRIAAELQAGSVVVVPGQAADHEVAWWRIDPQSGQVLGIGSRGWGQSMVEDVNHWLHEHAGVVLGIKFGVAVLCVFSSVTSETFQNYTRDGELTAGWAIGAVSCAAAFLPGGLAVALEAGELGWLSIVIDVLGLGIEQYEEYEEHHELKATRHGIE